MAYDETEKARLLYDRASKEADAALKKYEDTLKRPKSGLQSLKTLVTGKDAATVVQKLKTKSKQKSRELNEARNNYLLALQGLNSLQQLYDTEDISILIEKLDGKYYETLKNLFELFAKLQDDVANSVKVSAEVLKGQVTLINRAQETEQFLQENAAVFKANGLISFETIGLDTTKELVVDDVTKISLGQQLGLLLTHDTMLQGLKLTKEQELKGAKQLVDVYLQNPTASNGPSPLELIQEVQNSLDLIKCQRAKISSQIATLTSLGVVAIMPPKPEEQNPQLTNSGKQIAKLLYTYTTEKEDELAAIEGDEVEIIVPEKDGWLTAKHLKSGKEGLLPANYVQLLVSSASSSKNVTAQYGT
jgi:hypothetical protein